MRSLRNFGTSIALGLVGVLLAIPAVLVFVELTQEDHLEGISDRPTALVVPAGTVEVTDERVATAEFEWGEPVVALAPAWTGVVTEIHVTQGEEVIDLSKVVSVDGIDRIAVSTRVPFHRSLKAGDSGADVTALQFALMRMGYIFEVEVEGYFGSDTERAVSMLSRDLGLPESSSSFEPSWFVWLPERTLVVDKVEAVVGAPPPSAGATLISGATPLIAVELMDEFGDSVLLPEGTNWIATIGLNTVNVDTESGSVDDVADLRQLQVDTPTDTRTLVAQLLRQDSQLAITVPSSAVSVNESGRVCVWIESIAGEFTSVDVEVSRSVGGSARLSAGVEPGERVLSNPDQVAEAGPCP